MSCNCFLLEKNCTYWEVLLISMENGKIKKMLNSIFWLKMKIPSLRISSSQILANNSTPLRYSKKTRYSAITRVLILGRIGGYYLTRVIFESELNSHYKNQYLCMNDGIQASLNRAGIHALTEHYFVF